MLREAQRTSGDEWRRRELNPRNVPAEDRLVGTQFQLIANYYRSGVAGGLGSSRQARHGSLEVRSEHNAPANDDDRLRKPRRKRRAFAHRGPERADRAARRTSVRIGANYEQLPINASKCPIHSYSKDGAMAYHHSGSQPVYSPNSY
jgi:hypothetical protein